MPTKLLVVDGDADVLAALQARLLNEGHVVHESPRRAEILSLISAPLPSPVDDDDLQAHDLQVANQRLAFQLRLTRSITDTADVAIFVANDRGQVVFMNAHAEATFGYTFGELRGRPLEGTIHRHGQDGVTMPTDLSPELGRALVRRHEDVFFHKDGSPVPVLWSSAWIEADHEVAGAVLTVHDLRESRRAAAALRDSERFAQAALDALSTRIAVVDEQGVVISANRCWRETRFLSPSPLVAAAPGADYLAACEAAARDGDPAVAAFAAGVEAVVRGGIEAFACDYPCWIDGSRRWFSARLARYSGVGGSRVVIAQDDMTELRQAHQNIHALNESLEQRVRQRTAELEAANRELESFSSSVSHDLRAPLRVIEGFSTLLLRDHGQALTAEARRYLDLVHGSSRRMYRLIDDLLRLAHTTQQPLEMAPVDMEALVMQCVDDFRADIVTRDIQLSIGRLPACRGDAALLRQAFLNLIGNAVKYTRHSSAPAIEIGYTEQDGKPVYHVKDNGAGFDMVHAGKLFGAFQRLHPQDQFEGNGIGLALVQRIVQRHGGRIWAQASQGEGAAFYVSL